MKASSTFFNADLQGLSKSFEFCLKTFAKFDDNNKNVKLQS